VVEPNVHQGAVQVDVTDLQAAQLTAADTGGHHQPQVQPQGSAARAGLGYHLSAARRGGRAYGSKQ